MVGKEGVAETIKRQHKREQFGAMILCPRCGDCYMNTQGIKLQRTMHILMSIS